MCSVQIQVNPPVLYIGNWNYLHGDYIDQTRIARIVSAEIGKMLLNLPSYAKTAIQLGVWSTRNKQSNLMMLCCFCFATLLTIAVAKTVPPKKAC